VSDSAPNRDPPVVDVWIARDSLLDAPAVGECLARLLAPDERERRDRMAFESGRRQQLLTRAMQREVLSRCAPEVAPREWRFVRGPAGRPALAPPFDAIGLDFNIAHTRGLVAISIARAGRVGIDAEILDERVPLHLAPRYFSAHEVESLQTLPPAEQFMEFLRLWTLKEAYTKYYGMGAALDFRGVQVDLDPLQATTVEARNPRLADPALQQQLLTIGDQVLVLALAAGRPRE